MVKSRRTLKLSSNRLRVSVCWWNVSSSCLPVMRKWRGRWCEQDYACLAAAGQIQRVVISKLWSPLTQSCLQAVHFSLQVFDLSSAELETKTVQEETNLLTPSSLYIGDSEKVLVLSSAYPIWQSGPPVERCISTSPQGCLAMPLWRCVPSDCWAHVQLLSSTAPSVCPLLDFVSFLPSLSACELPLEKQTTNKRLKEKNTFQCIFL